jgi:hypothetical protein
MKDIESRLGETPVRSPRRSLSTDFTAQTMQRIAQRSQASLWRQLVSRLPWTPKGEQPMPKLSKTVAFASSFAVLALTAGTTFAAVQWLQPNVKVDQNSATTLPNGNKRVWLDLASCQGQDMPSPSRSYIEIKAGSGLTPQDIAKYLEANCESDLLHVLFKDVIPHYPKGTMPTIKPGQDQFYFPYATLKNVGKNFIVIDTGLNGTPYYDVKVPVDSDARFYLKGKPIKLQDLQPGKELTLVVHTTALDQAFSTETLRPDQIDMLAKDGLPIGATVKGAIQHIYNKADAQKAMEGTGREWTNLEKDSKSPDGWRQVTPLK